MISSFYLANIQWYLMENNILDSLSPSDSPKTWKLEFIRNWTFNLEKWAQLTTETQAQAIGMELKINIDMRSKFT